MGYEFDWSVVVQPALWTKALGVTLGYAVATIIGGLIIGVFCGLLALSRFAPARWLVSIYVQVFRCTPLLVQIVWFFYALPMLTGWQITAWVAAGTGLTLYMGSFATEIFRAGIMSIDKGQRQAAQSIGMNYYQTMRYIVLPQAMRRMIPPTVSQSILQLKNTSLLYIVAVPDLMYTASQITAQTYRPLETYTFVALVYLVVLYPLTVFSKRLESRDDQ